ncbi:MAG: SDR family oxidoreductase [Kofleriaceae bacterium]|nr:SDR family oxidoreductase [Kofleriaceae bacterium]
MQPILITGAGGTLGAAFRRICEQRGLACHLTTRTELDIASPDSVHAALDRHQPWLVINAAGYVRVDDAERDHERCHRENALGPEVLADACSHACVPMVSYSSDLVFDGIKHAPYDERDRPRPLGVYGRTKHEGEQRVLDRHTRALVVRTSAFFGPWDEHNFVSATLRELAAGRTVRAADDTTVSPTYVPDLVHASLDLAIDGETGVWHLANIGATTWAALARAAARIAGYAEDLVIGVSMRSLGLAAPRPVFSALGSTRGLLLPHVEQALGRYHGSRKATP